MPKVPDYLLDRPLTADCVTHKQTVDYQCPWCSLRQLVRCYEQNQQASAWWGCLQEQLLCLTLCARTHGRLSTCFGTEPLVSYISSMKRSKERDTGAGKGASSHDLLSYLHELTALYVRTPIFLEQTPRVWATVQGALHLRAELGLEGPKWKP